MESNDWSNFRSNEKANLISVWALIQGIINVLDSHIINAMSLDVGQHWTSPASPAQVPRHYSRNSTSPQNYCSYEVAQIDSHARFHGDTLTIARFCQSNSTETCLFFSAFYKLKSALNVLWPFQNLSQSPSKCTSRCRSWNISMVLNIRFSRDLAGAEIDYRQGHNWTLYVR